MVTLQQRITEKIEMLPENRLREVLNFVDFLMWTSGEQEEPLLSVAGILPGKGFSVEEIEKELYGDVR
jgi:hypothetical protein